MVFLLKVKTDLSFEVWSLDAGRSSIEEHTLAVVALGSQHPDAELADFGVVVGAAVGTVLAGAGFEDLRLGLSDRLSNGLSSWGSHAHGEEGGEDDGGETHFD